MTKAKPIRIGIMQRVLPSYRVPFFDALANMFTGNVSVFAGKARKRESISENVLPRSAKYWKAKNLHFFKGKYYLCWQAGLRGWLSGWRPDVLIVEANPRYLHIAIAVCWMRQHGGKVIGWGLGSPPTAGGMARLRASLRKHFLHQFDALITYSRQGALEYASLGYPAERIFTAPNAVAPRPTQPMPNRPDKFRGNRPVIAFVGRLQERKRVHTLIRACAALREDDRPLLWIIGDGPQRYALEALARDIYPLAQFFGAQHGENLAQRLRLADLFVLPGTGGLAVQEAMSYGLPVIVGISDGTQTDLVSGENGWLLQDDSASTLADAITDALSDVSVLRKKGEASYQLINKEINLEKMVSVFSKVIEKVLEV
ncbi:MAG: glycosyltransferase family 4 protein [Anaerolineaceae bacterium]|nr:glycosyltransferase family 4 protein [Anaerolineaceae bacterium]